MSATQISIVCFITAKEQTKLIVKDQLKYIARMAQSEDGNINYYLHVSADDDKLFVVYENWKDQSALDNHMDQPHLKTFLDNIENWLECPIEEIVCNLM